MSTGGCSLGAAWGERDHCWPWVLLLLLANCSSCGSLAGAAAQYEHNRNQCDDIKVTCWRSNAFEGAWLQQKIVFFGSKCASSTVFLVESVLVEAIHRLSSLPAVPHFKCCSGGSCLLACSNRPVCSLPIPFHPNFAHCTNNRITVPKTPPLSLCLLALTLTSPAVLHPARCWLRLLRLQSLLTPPVAPPRPASFPTAPPTPEHHAPCRAPHNTPTKQHNASDVLVTVSDGESPICCSGRQC